MGYRHKFIAKWETEIGDDSPGSKVLVESDAVSLSDLVGAFQGYLKACGFDWTRENSPFADDDGG